MYSVDPIAEREWDIPAMLTPPLFDWPKVPYVGVGCIVECEGRLLLVRNRSGHWSTPGGHLDFGESPEACAARETLEETGVAVDQVEFVAITNDVLPRAGKHYVTIWMRARGEMTAGRPGDPAEVADLGWFAPAELPSPLHAYFANLIAGRCLPPTPQNLPASVAESRERYRTP
jgi:8-oxo-dGTP diphosphatase